MERINKIRITDKFLNKNKLELNAVAIYKVIYDGRSGKLCLKDFTFTKFCYYDDT